MIRIFRTAFRIALSDNRKSKIKNRKLVGLSVIAVMLLMLGAMAEAQQPKKSRADMLSRERSFGSTSDLH